MPTITINKKEFFEQFPKEMTDEQLNDLLFDFGLEIDDIIGDEDVEYKIEVPANRYDLLCLSGLVNALKCYTVLGVHTELEVSDQVYEVNYVGDSIRPYIACAVIHDIDLTKNYKHFIDYQDKLHATLGRNRSLMAIGTHDFDKIKFPIIYRRKKLDEIEFVPLNCANTMKGTSILDFYRSDSKMKSYVALLENHAEVSIFEDYKEKVLSLPPLINSEYSKISRTTKNVFVEVTGTDLCKVMQALNCILYNFRGKQISRTSLNLEGIEASVESKYKHVLRTDLPDIVSPILNPCKICALWFCQKYCGYYIPEMFTDAFRIHCGSNFLVSSGHCLHRFFPLLNTNLQNLQRMYSEASSEFKLYINDCQMYTRLITDLLNPLDYSSQSDYIIFSILSPLNNPSPDPKKYLKRLQQIYDDISSRQKSLIMMKSYQKPIYEKDMSPEKHIFFTHAGVYSKGRCRFCRTAHPSKLDHITVPCFKKDQYLTSQIEINTKLGVNLSKAKCQNLLQKMMHCVKLENNGICISVSPLRSDILHKADIFEDIAIAYGYNNFVRKPVDICSIGSQLQINKFCDLLKLELTQCGFDEMLTLSLLSRKESNAASMCSNTVKLMNYKSSECEIIRSSLIPGLLKCASSNQHTQLPFKLFEISDVCLNTQDSVYNKRMLASLYVGKTDKLDLIIGLLTTLLRKCGLENFKYEQLDGLKMFFEKRCASITINEVFVGTLGVIHPSVCNEFKLPFSASCFEIDIDALFNLYLE